MIDEIDPLAVPLGLDVGVATRERHPAWQCDPELPIPHDGLADRQALDDFWRAPMAPQRDLFLRFRRRLIENTQVFGNFHNPRHLRGTAERLADRMAARGV